MLDRSAALAAICRAVPLLRGVLLMCCTLFALPALAEPVAQASQHAPTTAAGTSVANPMAPGPSPLPRQVAPPGERPPGTDALLADVERIITAFESDGWFDDRSVLQEVHPILLESVCRATLDARSAALAVLQSDCTTDPRRLFEQAGGELTSEVEEALHLERQRVALSQALDEARTACPFWVRPRLDFVSRQTTRDQFVLHFEGGGIVQLRNIKGDLAIGGGGSSRLLAGYGFGDDFSLIGGIEFGGGALIKESEGGQFTINYLPAIPVLLRFRDVDWHYDVELAPVALFQADDTRLSYGGRLGFNVGVSVLRTRGILPWAGVGIAVEHYVPSGGREAMQFLRGGLRVGLRWPP